MLVEYDFAVTQAAYVKAAMDELASFRPDGLGPAAAQALVDSAAPVRAAYVTKNEALKAARADRRLAVANLHEACVDFAVQAKSRYRKQPAILETLQGLPVRDESQQETLVRAEASAARWATLPPLGTPPAAFTVPQGGEVLALAEFQALIVDVRDADGAIPTADQDYQEAEAALHAKEDELRDFSSAALEQGRSQYNEGTPEREILDAIPTENPGGGGSGGPPEG